MTPRGTAVAESREHKKYERLIAATESLRPLVAAVAHPCDETSLRGALEAADAGLITPILVGTKNRIRGVSEVLALDLNGPVGPAAALYSLEFFQHLRTALAPGGALTLHLGSPVAQPQRVADLAQRLNSVFRIVRVYTMYIPLYGSLWSMAVCSDKLDPKAFTADEIDRRIEQRKLQELRFYNGETHEGVFALPNYVRELVIPARLKQPARGRRLGVVRAAAK